MDRANDTKEEKGSKHPFIIKISSIDKYDNEHNEEFICYLDFNEYNLMDKEIDILNEDEEKIHFEIHDIEISDFNSAYDKIRKTFNDKMNKIKREEREKKPWD